MELKLNTHLSDTQQKEILKNITIIVDTREKKNEHILNYFHSKGIKYIKQSLTCGDYSVLLNTSIEGFPKKIDLRNKVVIERKGSLEELSNNFAEGRTALENEFASAYDKQIDMTLLIEENNIYENIIKGNYKSTYHPNAFLGSLLSFIQRYNLKLIPITKNLAGEIIHKTLYYFCRELLKQ